MYWSAELPRKVNNQVMEGVKTCMFVPVYYNSFNASRIPELDMLEIVEQST